MLPQYKYPVAKLPIDVFIANRLAWKKKMEKAGKEIGFVHYDKDTRKRDI